MQVDSRGSVTLVIPPRRLDFSAAADFQEHVERALSGDGKVPLGLLIDCAGLDYVSSAGLRIFLIAARAAKRAKIGFAICGLRPAVQQVFDISGFDQLMTIHADRSSAISQMSA